MRRDPSHVLSLTVDEWVGRLERAGFEVETAQARELDWNYEEWMHNMAVARSWRRSSPRLSTRRRARRGRSCIRSGAKESCGTRTGTP